MEEIVDYVISSIYIASIPMILEAWGYIKEENRPYQEKLLGLYEKGGRELKYKDLMGREMRVGTVFSEKRNEFNPIGVIYRLIGV